MAIFRTSWHRLLRAIGMGALAGPDWVAPSNAITRAIYEGSTFVTMTSWDDQPVAPTAPAALTAANAETPAADADAPSRKGVAA